MVAAGAPLGHADGELEAPTTALLDRAYEIARGHLEGINEAAEELANMTHGDLRVLWRARRVTLDRLSIAPSKEVRQVMSLIRRALELGEWPGQWHDTNQVP